MSARTNGRGVSCSRVSLREMEQRFEQDPQVTHNTHHPPSLALSLSRIIARSRGHLTIVRHADRDLIL